MSRTIQILTRVGGFAATLLMCACLPIPHRHTLRAGAQFSVIDQARRPLPNAKVYTYEGNIIGGTLRLRESAVTDVRGQVTIRGQREWHLLMIFIPDAEAPSIFAWCVEDPGYQPLIRPMDDAMRQDISAPLIAGRSMSHCPAELVKVRLDDGTYTTRPAA